MPAFLVTGGAGFIGSHIVRALLAQGAAVRVLDNFSSGKRANLEGLGDGLEVMPGDLRDPETVRAAVQGVEVIFHQAAFVSVPESMQDPQACFETNVRGTELLLEASRHAGVRRVVLASSAAVYGESPVFPLEETTAPMPLSPYAASKLITEIYAELYTRSFGLEVAALRYFNVYGPRQRPDSQYAAAVPIFVRRMLDGRPIVIYGDGGQTRDLIYVGDVVAANLLAGSHPDAPGRVFNVCTGRETRLLDLVEILAELIPGAPAPEFAPVRQGDLYRSVGSAAKAGRLLGFQPRTSLLEGLSATVEAMRL